MARRTRKFGDTRPVALRVWTEVSSNSRTFHVYLTPCEVGDDGQPYGVDWRHPLRDLEIHSQGDAERAGNGLYSCGVEYRSVYSIDLRRAREIARILGKIERATAWDLDLGQYVDTVCDLFRIDYLYVPDRIDRFGYSNDYDLIERVGPVAAIINGVAEALARTIIERDDFRVEWDHVETQSRIVKSGVA